MSNHKTSILGITNLDFRSHDNAAVLINNLAVIAYGEEERFIRKKYAFDRLPLESIEFCLKLAQLTPQEIAHVCIGWDLRNAKFDKKGTIVAPPDDQEVWKMIFPNHNLTVSPQLHYVEHHRAHAASTFFSSGFTQAAVIVMDGSGEFEATSIWLGEGSSLTKVATFPMIPASIGMMYEGTALFLGFRGGDAGKVMGLGSYAVTALQPFENLKLSSDGYTFDFPQDVQHAVDRTFKAKADYYYSEYITELWKVYLDHSYGSSSQWTSNTPHLDERREIAGRLQKTLEIVLLHCSAIAARVTQSENLCIAGGVGLNCAANGVLSRSRIFKNIFHFPAAGDSGVALGAALHVHHTELRLPQLTNGYKLATTASWGPSFSDEAIEEYLRQNGIAYRRIDDTFQEVAQLLANGAVLGWFQGRAEIGPRALGNRSILADPRKVENIVRVNLIKRREVWRPFAPSVLAGFEKEFFVDGGFSPFMLKADSVVLSRRIDIPAVTHVDGSSRYQSVDKEYNIPYWRLIFEFYKLTGIPMVLNTSFNLKDPIVCSPADALSVLNESELDCVVLGHFLVEKKRCKD